MWRYLLALWLGGMGAVTAAAFDYALADRLSEVAPGVFVIRGDQAHFSAGNGGNILNTGFIVSSKGVLVIDTGPSAQYGEQMRALIGEITAQPITRVLNTHHHPDHYFGNQAFADVPIAATAASRAAMAQLSGDYADAMYRLVGPAMFGTEYLLPTETLQAGEISLGERRIDIKERAGHTRSELIIRDTDSGVLFVGDLVFNERAATTPDADIARWLQTLSELAQTPFSQLVPGHGPVDDSSRSIQQTAAYLQWLRSFLSEAAARGATAAEALYQPVPAPFDGMAVMPEEYQRSVHHLFPALEQLTFYPPLSLRRN